MDPAAEIQALAAHGNRLAGTDAERRAAVHLQRLVQAGGREAELQPLLIRPRFAAAQAISAAVVVVGSVVAVSSPVAGLMLVLAGTASAFLDVAGILHLARRLTGRRASQNVESREQAGKAGVLVLVAPYDQGRRAGGLTAVTRVVKDPWLVALAAMIAVLGCCAARVAGAEGTPLTVVQFVPTLLLILAVVVLIDAELSDAAPSPARDAAAVTAVRLASDAARRPRALRHLAGADRRPAAVRTGDGRLAATPAQGDRSRARGGGRSGPGRRRAAAVHAPRGAAACRCACTAGCGASARRSRRTTAKSRRRPWCRASRPMPQRPSRAGCRHVTVSGGRRPRSLHGFCHELILRLDAEVGPALPAARPASEVAGRRSQASVSAPGPG